MIAIIIFIIILIISGIIYKKRNATVDIIPSEIIPIEEDEIPIDEIPIDIVPTEEEISIPLDENTPLYPYIKYNKNIIADDLPGIW